MFKQITLLFLCFLSINSFGQGLTLENDQQQKSFKAGSIFEIVLNNKEKPIEKCCNQTTLVGAITAATKDSIQLKLSTFSQSKTLEKTAIHQLFNMAEQPVPKTIAQQDIFSLRHYKSLKSKKNKKRLGTVGGLLVIAGLGTALNSVLVNKDQRKNLLIAGGAQFALGFTLGMVSTSKRYKFKDTHQAWRIN